MVFHTDQTNHGHHSFVDHDYFPGESIIAQLIDAGTQLNTTSECFCILRTSWETPILRMILSTVRVMEQIVQNRTYKISGYRTTHAHLWIVKRNSCLKIHFWLFNRPNYRHANMVDMFLRNRTSSSILSSQDNHLVSMHLNIYKEERDLHSVGFQWLKDRSSSSNTMQVM